ncbi:MAG: DNA-binding transcriptional regulator CytR [Lentisphaerae bacterium ADurb.Bin242]|nr:MAG: DNA-binding transcriptional regulator CytR [Lentisphaerae bacterium ADurb.Bin242]
MFTEKYKNLSGKLETYIAERKLSGRLPGIARLSRIFGVNKTTMNKAVWMLEGKGILSINGLRGTFINEAPRRTLHHIIGVNGYPGGPHHTKIMDTLNKEAEKAGYQLITVCCHSKAQTDNADFFLQFPIDGIIFHGSCAGAATLKKLKENGVETVSCGIPGTEEWLDAVDLDHRATYQNILEYLRLLGHRRIAFIEFKRSPEWTFYIENIRRAFADTLGPLFDPELFFVRERVYDLIEKKGEDYFNIYAEMAVSRFLSLPEPPTAIITMQKLAVSLSAPLKKRNRLVPRDISVFSISYPDEYDKRFSSAVVNTSAVVKQGLELILRRLKNPSAPVERKYIPMTLKIGRSTRRTPEPAE